jgi:signal transduction histidine kinase
MGLRHRSIRLRVGILIVVPVLCLIALYGFVASLTLGNALQEAHAKALKDQLLTPLGTFETQLYKERHLAVLMLAQPSSTALSSALGKQENTTQQAFSAFQQDLRTSSVRADATAHVQSAIDTLVAAAGQLSGIRTAVSASAISMTKALSEYGAIVDDSNAVIKGILNQQPSVPIVTQALDVIDLDQVAQTTLAENDLLAGDMAQGRLPASDRIAFAQLAAQRQSELASTLPQLDPGYRKLIATAVTPTVSNGLTSLEASVITTPWRHGPPASIVRGSTVFTTYTNALTGAVAKIGVDLADRSQSSANDVFAELFLVAGLGLAGILVSIGLSLYIGRGLLRQLRNLRESALGLAREKLPTVIRRLREGEAVDLSEYVAPDEVATSDEIEQVQYAFNVVQQTAVQSAVDEARLRRGISDVFRNLAGRSQSLLHRQLTLLDGMERRATEPDELEDLFRIDHLTTRMRRHAEGLIILSGEAPARGWRQPVPLIDVLRAAVAEVEDYTRIRVFSRTRSAVSGHAVADVIHLVAELAENATVFSPPNTPVRIQGDVVGRGLAIEIEDRGLGISADRLAELNGDLANPPQFDLSDSDRLGLFISGQLARRHGITVTLQPSVYGGTTAVVLLPSSLVVEESTFIAEPALESGEHTGGRGRHAALAGAERGLLTAGNGAGNAFQAESGPPSLPPADDHVVLGDTYPPQQLTGIPADPPSRLTGYPADPPSRLTGIPADPPSRLTGYPADPPSRSAPFPGDSPSRPDQLPKRMTGVPAQRAPDDADTQVTPAVPAAAEPSELGLPVRVRQANLAPQLRNRGQAMGPAPAGAGSGEPGPGAPAASSAGVAPSPPAGPSPEEARSTMSALQRGWQLGRAEADVEEPAQAQPGPAEPGLASTGSDEADSDVPD